MSTNNIKTDTNRVKLDYALAYSKAGFKVFPIKAGTKDRPLVKNWGVVATSDPDQITKLWTRWPDANIGLACGPSKIGVIDSDVKPGGTGETTLAELASAGKVLSPTKTSRTPSGGIHRFFRGALATTSGRIGKFVDTRGYGRNNGGYVLLPPSETAVGKYEWIDRQGFAPLDAWVADVCNGESREQTNNDTQNVDPESADLSKLDPDFRALIEKGPAEGKTYGDGTRSGFTYYIAAELRRQGFSDGQIIDVLINPDYAASAHVLDQKQRDPVAQASRVIARLNKDGVSVEADAQADFAADPVQPFTAAEEKEQQRIRAENAAPAFDLKDFVAYLPETDGFIYIPAGADEMWPGKSVNVVCDGPPVIDPVLKAKFGDHQTARELGGLEHGIFAVDAKTGRLSRIAPTVAIMSRREQRVAGMTWWPGKPAVVRNTLVRQGGTMHRRDVHMFNRYRGAQPLPAGRQFAEPTPWLNHVRLIYPDDANHIIHWLAWRVQHPEIKILHALVLGGSTRIGKDTILKPVKRAIGPWNFTLTDAQKIMDEPKYNAYLEGVICLINEAKDFGDENRFAFYNRMKPWIGGTASDVLMVADKYVRAHPVIDLVGFIITTNFKVRGLFLPPDDARHYMAWSNRTWQDWGCPDQETLKHEYFDPLYDYYDNGGNDEIMHYLQTLPLESAVFDPKAPPPKTAAWHEVVAAQREEKESDLVDILASIGDPPAVTVQQVKEADSTGELEWHANAPRNKIAADFEDAGYARQHNPNSKDGDWKVGPKTARRKIVIYVQAKLTAKERLQAAQEVAKRESAAPAQADDDADFK